MILATDINVILTYLMCRMVKRYSANKAINMSQVGSVAVCSISGTKSDRSECISSVVINVS